MGYAGVGVGRGRHRVADGQVDAEVTATHTEEGNHVEEEKTHDIDLSREGLHIHGQTDTHLQDEGTVEGHHGEKEKTL